MELTGKAKAHFLYWLHNSTDLKASTVRIVNAIPALQQQMAVEWLDSVGFHIQITPHIGGGACVFYAKVIFREENFIDTWEDLQDYFSDRIESTEAAINKAISIYNER